MKRLPATRQFWLRLHLLLWLAIALLLVQCARNPVTGKREITLISEAEEIRLGRESDPAIVAQYGLVDDPELAAYVDRLGQEMVKVCHRPDLTFTFRLLDDPIVNAFALPGGYVYVTRGILAYLDDEAALAGVIGHEIGHVTARHGVQHITQQQLFGLGIGLGSVFSETFAEYAGLAGTAAQLMMLKYGRDDERQSDRLGVEYASRTGYDTEEMAQFFNTLDQLTESAGGGGLPSWASTHPDPGERHQTVLALTRDWQARAAQPEYRRNRAEFLRRIEGLVFGANPRNGYVDGNSFLHPDLEFRFPIPAGWNLHNTPTQVQVAAPDGKAALLFALETEHATPPQAADAFITQSQATVKHRQPTRIGGFTALRLDSSITQESGVLEVHSTWIKMNDRLYVFHGLGNQPEACRQAADGFRRLRDRQALAIQPVVMRIVPASRRGTLAAIIADYPIPDGIDFDLAALAMLNGLSAGEQVEKGTLIKTLHRRPR